MTAPRALILTGERGAGKTMLCLALAALSPRYRGLVSPSLLDRDGNRIGLAARCLATGGEWVLGRSDAELDGPRFGRFSFSSAGIARAVDCLRGILGHPPDTTLPHTTLPDTTLPDATPGDLSFVFPYRHLVSIIEMLQALEQLAPGVYSRHTLLYGVEVKFYSSRVEVDSELMTQVAGLYAVGDGAGVTRGLVQSSASGIVAARAFLRNRSTP